MRRKVNQLLTKYIRVMVIVPCALLAMIISYDVYQSYQKRQDAVNAQSNVFASQLVLDLIHELQKERGLSAGFLGSNGNKFSSELTNQKRVVDKQLGRVKQQSEQLSASSAAKKMLSIYLKSLNNMTVIRQKVSSQNVSVQDVLAFYTDSNSKGFELVLSAARLTENPKVAKDLYSLYNFSSTKEYAGIERALVSNILSIDQVRPEILEHLMLVISKQDSYLKVAINSAPDDLSLLMKKATTNKEIERYRQVLLSKKNQFELDAKNWFALATKRIEKLKQIETDVSKKTFADAVEAQDEADIVLYTEVIIFIIAVLVTIALVNSLRVSHQQSLLIVDGIRKAIDDKNLIHHIDVISADELGQAAEGINALTAQFDKDLLNVLRTAKKITSSTHETAVAISDTQTNLTDQQHGVQKIVESAEEMAANIQHITESMVENAQSASQVASDSVDGQKVVLKAVSVIKTASQNMETSATSISELNEKISSIKEMVVMIQAIAEQTNLLALNAAIEAARAGEQGRGFAVVADEVRSLAGRTQQITEQISNLVVDLETNSTSTTDIIMQSRDSATDAAEKAEKIKEALELIISQVRNVESVTNKVSQRTAKQSEAINDVHNSVARIFEKATDNVTGASQIAMAASLIADSSMDLHDLIDVYVLSSIEEDEMFDTSAPQKLGEAFMESELDDDATLF